MLKYILSFIFVLFTISVSADDYTCTVANSGGVVATFDNTTGKSDGKGVLAIVIKLNQRAPKKINVLVNIYDAETGQFVKTESNTIPNGYSNDRLYVKDLKPYHPYYFKLHDASCESKE